MSRAPHSLRLFVDDTDALVERLRSSLSRDGLQPCQEVCEHPEVTMVETKFGTFAELMAQSAEPMRPIAKALRKMILEIDPDAVEVVRLGDRAATFGMGPSKTKEAYTYVLPHTKWVNVGFFRASAIEDPDGLMEGTGANMRHVKVRALADVDKPALRALIVASLAERRETLGTTT